MFRWHTLEAGLRNAANIWKARIQIYDILLKNTAYWRISVFYCANPHFKAYDLCNQCLKALHVSTSFVTYFMKPISMNNGVACWWWERCFLKERCVWISLFCWKRVQSPPTRKWLVERSWERVEHRPGITLCISETPKREWRWGVFSSWWGCAGSCACWTLIHLRVTEDARLNGISNTPFYYHLQSHVFEHPSMWSYVHVLMVVLSCTSISTCS